MIIFLSWKYLETYLIWHALGYNIFLFQKYNYIVLHVSVNTSNKEGIIMSVGLPCCLKIKKKVKWDWKRMNYTENTDCTGFGIKKTLSYFDSFF